MRAERKGARAKGQRRFSFSTQLHGALMNFRYTRRYVKRGDKKEPVKTSKLFGGCRCGRNKSRKGETLAKEMTMVLAGQLPPSVNTIGGDSSRLDDSRECI